MSAPTIGDIELGAWLDGEVAPDRREAIARWLRANPDASTRVENWRRQNDVIRARFARIAAESPPESIWPSDDGRESGRVASPRGISVVGDRDAPIQVERFDRYRRDRRARLAVITTGSFIAGAAAVLVAVMALGYAPALMMGVRAIAARSTNDAPTGSTDALIARAVDAHRTFVRDSVRPVEVTGDAPRVSEFLSSRIGLAVKIPVLEDEGLRLIGARLTPGDLGPSGLVVYEADGGDRFGLVIGRAPGEPTRPIQVRGRRTSGVATWFARGVGFALIGPNDPSRLARFAALMEDHEPALARSP